MHDYDEKFIDNIGWMSQTLIESNFRNSTANFTTEFEEYYDFVNNRGTIIKFSLFGEIRQYFLYETDEMITIYGIMLLIFLEV